MNKLFFRVPFIALLVVAALYGATPSAKAQSGSGEDPNKWIPLQSDLTPKAQSGSGLVLGSGLEVDNPKEVQVAIEYLDDDAKEAGLSRSLIRTKVNLRLRQNGLTPINAMKGGYLYVKITVVNSAFDIDVHFSRLAVYPANSQVFKTMANTWARGGAGTFGNDKDFILNNLEDLIDEFIDAYLSANNL